MYGNKISLIRRARGYSQDYVAAQLHVAQNTYSKMERDEDGRISDSCMERIALVLGVSVEDIKSPTPIVMSFRTESIEELRRQIEVKDQQIASLLRLLEQR